MTCPWTSSVSSSAMVLPLFCLTLMRGFLAENMAGTVDLRTCLPPDETLASSSSVGPLSTLAMASMTAPSATSEASCEGADVRDVKNGGAVGDIDVTYGSMSIGRRRPANALSRHVASFLADLTFHVQLLVFRVFALNRERLGLLLVGVLVVLFLFLRVVLFGVLLLLLQPLLDDVDQPIVVELLDRPVLLADELLEPLVHGPVHFVGRLLHGICVQLQ